MNSFSKSVQFSHSVMSDSWQACQASLSINNSWSLLKLMSIELVMPSNHLILCHSLLLLPSIFPSIRIFSNESVVRIRWPKYWIFSISPSNEYSGLIFFRIVWFDLLAVQGTHRKLLQHHSSKASVLWCSTFFTVQLSHPHMTTIKTIALARRTFVSKVMPLLFTMLFRLVILFRVTTLKWIMPIRIHKFIRYYVWFWVRKGWKKNLNTFVTDKIIWSCEQRRWMPLL